MGGESHGKQQEDTKVGCCGSVRFHQGYESTALQAEGSVGQSSDRELCSWPVRGVWPELQRVWRG